MKKYTTQKNYEDLYSIGTKVMQISRALRIVAEDTTDRFKAHDLQQNMEVLYLLANNLDEVAESLDVLDEYRAKHGEKVADIL